MSSCKQYKEWFVEALYKELPEQRSQEFTNHLTSCPECMAKYRKLSATLSIMDERKHAEPSPEFWLNFDRKLQSKLEASKDNEATGQVRNHSFGMVPSAWWKAAAAVLLVGFGMIIGKYYLGDREAVKTVVIEKQPQQKSPVQQAAMDPETYEFLERSEILLVGLVNIDTSDREYVPELSAQKKMSEDLIQEAAVLKTKLRGSDQRRLRRLVTDLEVILLQIANLEAEGDYPEIEIVKSGVDRKGVLLKINLERMGKSGAVRKPEQDASGNKTL